jgi:hypothetical protein
MCDPARTENELMPRIRYLKPEFFLDEDLSFVTVEARLTFGGLWCHADREGRLEDRPAYLKTQIWPYQDVDMDSLLAELARPKTTDPEETFILRYSINKKKYIQIVNFLEHQKPHHTERRSVIPPPLTVNLTLKDGEPREGIGIGKKIYGEIKGMGKGMGSEEGKGKLVSDGANDGGNAEGHPPVAPTLSVDPEVIKLGEIIKRRQAEGIPH